MPQQKGLRFLAKVFQNLPDELKNKTKSKVVPIRPNIESSTLDLDPISILDQRLKRIESLLEKMLVQKREKIALRDSDGLITKVIDQPIGNE